MTLRLRPILESSEGLVKNKGLAVLRLARLDYVQLKSHAGKNLTQTARACPFQSEGLDVSTK